MLGVLHLIKIKAAFSYSKGPKACSYKTFNIKIALLFVIALFSLHSYALEQVRTKQKYPPYPDVWGYDLVDNPMIPDGFTSLSQYPHVAPNGDIVFSLSKCIKACDEDPLKRKLDFAMLWFFEGKVALPKDIDEYIKKNNLKSASILTSIGPTMVFQDGTGVSIYTSHTGTYCQPNELLETVLLKGKPSPGEDKPSFYNEKVEKFSVIEANAGIARSWEKEDGLCDRGGPGGGQLVYKQLYSINHYVWLGESGLIAVGRNLIVRLDKNFNTKFKAKHNIELAGRRTIIKGNFFVLPYSKIAELDHKVSENRDHGVQGLHDELLLYLYERQNNNNT